MVASVGNACHKGFDATCTRSRDGIDDAVGFYRHGFRIGCHQFTRGNILLKPMGVTIPRQAKSHFSGTVTDYSLFYQCSQKARGTLLATLLAATTT